MDPTIIYIFALISISVVFLCIALIYLYLKEVSKYEELKLGKEKIKLDPEVILEQAQARSQKILEEAHIKAREVVSQAQTFLTRDEGVLSKEIEKAQVVYLKSYNEAIGASQNKALQMLQNIPQDIKMTLISVIDNFRVSLTKEIGKAQEEANQTIREAYTRAADEVNKYKEERMKQVDSAILSVVREVTEKVLGKSISTEEHEKLVTKALEEAKRQKIF